MVSSRHLGEGERMRVKLLQEGEEKVDTKGGRGTRKGGGYIP